MRICVSERPGKNGKAKMTIIKVRLLCRLNPDDECTFEEIDQIDVVGFSYSKDDLKFKQKRFTLGSVFLISNFARFLKQKNALYSNSSHTYELQFTIDSGKEHLSVMSGDSLGDQCPKPISMDDYSRRMRFSVTLISDLSQQNQFASICGQVECITDTMQIKTTGNCRRNITVKDSSEHSIMVTAFGEQTCSLFSEIKQDDLVFIGGVSVSKYGGISLTFNEESLLLLDSENLRANLSLIPHIPDQPASRRTNNNNNTRPRCLTSGAPQRSDEYSMGSLSDLLDNATLLNEEVPRKRFSVLGNIVGFTIEGDLWKYHCPYEITGSGLSCFKPSNPTKDGRWVCTLKRPDGSLPEIDGEDSNFKKERNHTGHVTETVLCRTSINVQLRDPTLNPEQVVVAKLKHECLMKLFGDIDQIQLAELSTNEISDRLSAIIDAQTGDETCQQFGMDLFSRNWDASQFGKTYKHSFKFKLSAKYRPSIVPRNASNHGRQQYGDDADLNLAGTGGFSYFVFVDSLEITKEMPTQPSNSSWDDF